VPVIAQKLFFAWLQMRLIEASCSLSAAEHQMRKDDPFGYLAMIAKEGNLKAVQDLGNIALSQPIEIKNLLNTKDHGRLLKLSPELQALQVLQVSPAFQALQALQALQELTTNSSWDGKVLATKQLDRYHQHQEKQKSHQLTFAR
jgi:hypothetical protein